MRKLTVAATQMSCSWNIDENIVKAEKLVRNAAAQGAQLILLQELFETPYFCQKEELPYYNLATEPENNKAVNHFQKIAAELRVVLPVSFYERKNNARYNSVAMIDDEGKLMGVYRKTHIPDGPGYEEKFYFNPGDSGFKVWETRYAKVGVGICWDQWYPETARCLALMGAEVLLFPTAIGSEPAEIGVDSKNHWQLCMQGHAAANIMPVVASNRIGVESAGDSVGNNAGNSVITFYGSSFITNHKGEKLVEADRISEGVIVAEFDLDEIEAYRTSWGIFRDRRPEMYRVMMTSDGTADKL